MWPGKAEQNTGENQSRERRRTDTTNRNTTSHVLYKATSHSFTSLRYHTLRCTLVCVRLWVGRGLVECFIFFWASLAKALVHTRPSAASTQLSPAASEHQHERGYTWKMHWIFTMETCLQEKVRNLRFYVEHNWHYLIGKWYLIIC